MVEWRLSREMQSDRPDLSLGEAIKAVAPKDLDWGNCRTDAVGIGIA
jgi:hypothetical protein